MADFSAEERTAPKTPAGMVDVTKEQFFAYVMRTDVGDIHPSTVHSPFYSVWELQHSRTAIGRSYPGWKNPEDVAAYMLTEEAARKVAA